MEIEPGPVPFEVLGRFLAERGRDEEAYDALVGSLAWRVAETEGSEGPGEIRVLLKTVARRPGVSGAGIDADIASAAEQAAANRRREILAERVDRPAPDFELEDTRGRSWRLSDLRGKVVVLNYWAVWCGPCRAEFPHYARLVEEYASDGVVFLAVATDEDRSQVEPFLEENGYDFTVVYDEGTETDYDISGIPATVMIGTDGRVGFRDTGFDGAARYLEKMRLRLDALLAHVEG